MVQLCYTFFNSLQVILTGNFTDPVNGRNIFDS